MQMKLPRYTSQDGSLNFFQIDEAAFKHFKILWSQRSNYLRSSLPCDDRLLFKCASSIKYGKPSKFFTNQLVVESFSLETHLYLGSKSTKRKGSIKLSCRRFLAPSSNFKKGY